MKGLVATGGGVEGDAAGTRGRQLTITGCVEVEKIYVSQVLGKVVVKLKYLHSVLAISLEIEWESKPLVPKSVKKKKR